MNTKDSRGHRQKTESVVHMLREREFSERTTRPFQKAAHVTECMIRRLGLSGTLKGHKSCVNCIEWSDDGRLLLSGSDDTKVIIWDALRKKQLDVIPTRHVGNIFSVKFLPRTNCSKIVTGAGDSVVTVVNVANSSQPPLLHCRCHAGRVKRIATAPDLPDVFWSAGEDGLILQFDLRVVHICVGGRRGSSGTLYQSGTRGGGAVLVDLCRHAGWHAEAKCVSVNPVKPHLIAVGANDSYVRLYDRRMMKTSPYRLDRSSDSQDRQACLARVSQPDDSIPHACARYFSPGHLGYLSGSIGNDEFLPNRHYKISTTYVDFSPLGNELLVNLGGDHIYLYDINCMENYTQKLTKPPVISSDSETNGRIRNNIINKCCLALNECFPIGDLSFDEIPGRPNTVPTTNPKCTCEFIARADAFMKRKWLGDYYAAARDYLAALNFHDIRSKRARRPLIGILYALVKLKWWKAATAWLEILREHHDLFDEEFLKLEEVLQKAQISQEKPPIPPQSTSIPDQGGAIVTSDQEMDWRAAAGDYQTRFMGHCNTTTDIKEAAYIDTNGKYIAAGSDDGALYIWRRDDSTLLTALVADSSIVNCVQPHPTTCLIATSGIEAIIKLWQPLSDNINPNNHALPDIWQASETNQQRIAMDPFETMMSNMGYQMDSSLIPPFHMSACQTS